MSNSVIGILGLGFLGKTLAQLCEWPEGSWGTWFRHSERVPGLKSIHYDWQNREHWPRIPEHEAVLVLAIPPFFREPKKELERLRIWAAWLRQRRPTLRRLIYLSTTGVYPKQEGLWSEDSLIEPDTESGRLRLQTERELAQEFQLQVIRPGGIYGLNRDLITRLRSGKSIPDSGMPTHRIHVRDLAEIVCFCIKHPEVRCLNAVDDDPAPSPVVAHWLLDKYPGLAAEIPNKSRNCDSRVKTRRIISNLKLKELGIRLEYPTFREGMAFVGN